MTVGLERRDLEQQKKELTEQQTGFTIKMKELEDGILNQLADAEGDVTENIALIENLEDSKATSIEIAEKMEIAKVTRPSSPRRARPTVASPTAARPCSSCSRDLFKIHTFHFYSLNSFDLVYQRDRRPQGAGRRLEEDKAQLWHAAQAQEARRDARRPRPRRRAREAQARTRRSCRGASVLVDATSLRGIQLPRRGLSMRTS